MKNEKFSLWQKRIADKKSSGLKLDEWCAKNQLTKHAYYYWKRKLTDLETSSLETSLFVEVPSELTVETEIVPDVMVIQWNELSIHVTDSHSVNLAAELLAKLGKLC
jgi:hypothetical protein